MRSLLIWVLLVVLPLMGSCGPHKLQYDYTHIPASPYTVPIRTIPVWIDKEFSGQDKITIDNSLMQWNYALNGWIVLKVVDYNFDMDPLTVQQARSEKGWMILKVASGNPTIPDANGEKTGAWTNGIGGNEMKVVRDRIPENLLTPVVLHEIGHLLSLEHSPDSRNLMYWMSSPTYICVDYDAVSRVFKFNHLDLGQMNYCVHYS